MKTRTFINIGVSIIVGFVVMFAAIPVSAGDKIKFSLASEYPDKHPTIKNGILPWIDDVKEKTGGKLKIQFFNPNALVPAKDAYAGLMIGAVDMILTPSQQSARGKFPLSSVALLPFMFKNANSGAQTVWELYNKYPEMKKEYDGMKVLFQWTSAPFEVHTNKKPVQSLEDLKGLKMIVWTGELVGIVEALGANPVEMTPHDTYLALQRGMADGVICPIAPMKAFKISDVTKHHTIVGIMSTHFYAGVNADKWNKLPADVQKVLLDTTGRNMVDVAARTLDDGDKKDTEWMKNKGHKFYTLSDTEKERWKARIQPIVDKWIGKMEGLGYANAGQFVKDAYTLGVKHSK
ncbi:MAG: TRAP transporter substrate-binding protein [Desulfobacterales bacterium]|nr:TRAP transporter substrate-binding protein [Desulfobacterales bacterium]